MDRVRHHFTVDVEEYFQVSALERWAPRERWSGFESRLEAPLARLLELLARHEATGTFFVLGWIADRNPGLVRDIAAAGHEIASHGWEHERVTRLGPEAFRRSAGRSKALLEDVTGQSVAGYRAPSFSIVPGREWALDVLLELGYRYDSSLFPVSRRGYGYPRGGRDPHFLRRRAGDLYEIPPTTIRLLGANLPAGGGAYFRLLPFGLVRAGLLSAERRGTPGTFYLHPWELDPEQPRFPVPWTTRIRHYGGLPRVERRLERLLREFRFQAIARGLSVEPDACRVA